MAETLTRAHATAAPSSPPAAGTREEDARADTISRLLAGEGFRALTGLEACTGEEVRQQGARAYRHLARLVHPDLAAACDRASASRAFASLTESFETWARGPAVRLRTRSATYEVGEMVFTGEVCASYEARALASGEPGWARTEVRIPHSFGSNDLMGQEGRALHALASGEERWRVYFPRVREQIRHRDENGVERIVNALERPPGLHSLAEVIAAHPGGLDPRDAAWMWRRSLVALGAAHRVGVYHTSVWPEHIWIEPQDHGVVLDGWWYACLEGEKARAVLTSERGAHPSELLVQRRVDASTDTYELALTMARLMGARTPRALRALVRGCTLADPQQRPRDAWALLGELDEILERLWGPRRWRTFTMPARVGGGSL